MAYMKKFLIVALALVVLMSLMVSVAFAQDPDNGQVLWDEMLCKRCHGEMGEGVFGAPLAGRSTGDDALSLEDWLGQVHMPRNRMPTFASDQVSDEELTDMYAYIMSLPVPEEFGFQRIELPDDAHPGQALIVDKRCVACHTTTGPIGGFERRGEIPTAEAVITQLRTPRNNMPSFREDQVSDEEAALIAEFLASQLSEPAEPEETEMEAEPEETEMAAAPAPSAESLSMLLGLLSLLTQFILP